MSSRLYIKLKPKDKWAHIKGVCFDIDGTLYDQRRLRANMIKVLSQAYLKKDLTLAEISHLRSFRKVREELRHRGQVSRLEREQYIETAKRTGQSPEMIEKTVQKWIHQVPLKVLQKIADEDVVQTCTRLRARGYRLGIFSDYPAEDKLRALGIPLDLFDSIVCATQREVDAFKPHPAGFSAVCDGLGISTEKVLYIGDRSRIDAEGARNAGMPAVILKRFGMDNGGSDTIRSLQELEMLLTAVPCAQRTNLEGCWICGGHRAVEVHPSSIERLVTAEDLKITDSNYGNTARLVRCSDCGFVYADPLPAEDLISLYSSLIDEEYESSSGAREKAFDRILTTIRRLRPDAKTLLDIGTGLGTFCKLAGEKGFVAEGVEPSSWAVREGRRRYGVTLHEGTFPHCAIEGKKFDIITLLDVIEHVEEPISLLNSVRNALNDTGLVVLVTPNIKARAVKLLGRRWWHFRVAHIGFFSIQTMLAALGRTELALEYFEPYKWWFPLGYLAQRLERYLPVAPLNKLIASNSWTRKFFERAVPLNLGDSIVYYARPISGRE